MVGFACGGPPHPAAPPPFDATRLAAELDAATRDMVAIAQHWQADCPRLLDELGGVEDRARRPVAEARAAEQDPDRAQQLTTAVRAYDRAADGRAQTIAMALAACWQQHVELRDRVQRVVDSMPTL